MCSSDLMTGAGAYMTDAIFDASRALRRDPAARQAIVVFVDETGEEFSNSGRSQVLEALRFANAQLFVVALQGAAINMNSTEARDRSAIIDEGTSQTGGTTLPLMNRLSLPQKMTELAALLNGQIQITYGRPEQTVPPKKLEIQLITQNIKNTAKVIIPATIWFFVRLEMNRPSERKHPPMSSTPA